MSPGHVSRLVPVLSNGFPQEEVQTSGACVPAVGRKSLARPGALCSVGAAVVQLSQ